MIAYNAVYQFVGDGKRLRIIDLNHDAGICVYVLIEGMCMPVNEKLEALESMLESNELVEIIDPFYEIEIEGENSEIDYQRCEERHEIIRRYWPDQKERLLNKKTRVATLKEIEDKEGIPLFTLKRLFSQYWQRGMRKSALYTSYSNSGSKGKKRTNRNKSGAKRADGYAGLIIDERIEKIFATVLKRNYETEKKLSLNRVYHQMLAEYFSKSVTIGGEKKMILYDEDHYPTLKQFKYYFKNNIDHKESYIARETLNKFNLNDRPLTDNETNQIRGPGDCFEIDATPGDIYLVSKSNRNKVIGRPTIYIIEDVYSRLVTGCYIGLENPSWNTASLAFVNMVEDKVKFCKSRGISIDEEQWPCHHLPKLIKADRGEVISNRADYFINILGVIVQNTPPYRGDGKGVVERVFGEINEHLRETLPGGIHKNNLERGDKDPRQTAALTLEECERIIIELILRHNSKIIEKYPSTPAQIEAGVPSVPLCLWEYGINEKTGSLRTVDTKKMSMNLWPHNKASLGREGLRFRNLYYGDIQLSQLSIASRTPVEMDIVYNPYTVNYVYVLQDGAYRQAHLQPSCSEFENMSFSEYEDYRATEKDNTAMVKRNNTQGRAAIEGMLQEESRKAEKRKKEMPKTTKAARTKNIREDRQKDKMDERRARNAETPKSKPATITAFIEKKPHGDYMEQMQTDTAALMEDLFGDNN